MSESPPGMSSFQKEVTVPSESSLTPVIMFLERLHGVDLGSGQWTLTFVAPEVNRLQSNDSGRLDLTAASDLVTPAAVLLHGGGGKIVEFMLAEEGVQEKTTEKLLF